MKTASIVWCLMFSLAAVGSALAQATRPEVSGIDEAVQAAQLDVELASARLALIQAQASLAAGKPAEARARLADAQRLLASLERRTDMTAYRQIYDRLVRDVGRADDTQRRLADAAPPPSQPVVVPAEPVPPVVVGGGEDVGPGYGDPRYVHPTQPGLPEQSRAAANQVHLARENAYTNVPQSRVHLTDDPAVITQRTLDHQTRWDMGRYAPARELVDVGLMLELDMERIHYQATISKVRDGARRDELLHIVEAGVPPPYVMNYPDDWKCIEEARAKYADGKLWESQPFKDSDGKTKTVAVYDVSDLLFVPIFPGPAEYNVRRPADPERFWARQERDREYFTHPQHSWPYYYDYGYGYGYPYGGYPAVPPPPPVGATTVPNGAANGSYYGAGGYYGYRVTDVIGTAGYYPFEADPIYQYRLASKRAQLLQAVNRMMSTVQD